MTYTLHRHDDHSIVIGAESYDIMIKWIVAETAPWKRLVSKSKILQVGYYYINDGVGPRVYVENTFWAVKFYPQDAIPIERTKAQLEVRLASGHWVCSKYLGRPFTAAEARTQRELDPAGILELGRVRK